MIENEFLIYINIQLYSSAYEQIETLYLCTTGTLEGKYVYLKEINSQLAYLKKCSSILGQSYVSTKSVTLLVLDKLDLGALIDPNGAYDKFKRTASTICQGKILYF